jgi:hypothetical protein
LREPSGFTRFFLVERVDERASAVPNVALVSSKKLTKERRAARVRKYRAMIDELQRKPMRFAKKMTCN